MESKYYREEINGITRNVYKNEVYDLTILSNGNVNMDRRIQEPDTTINQLIEDLARTTLKMQTLMDVFKDCAQRGIIPDEYIDKLSSYVYGMQSEEPSKKL